jgi:predicted naringenin-chalcone synthase
MMGFKLTNTGLQMILDIEVPDTISSCYYSSFFRKNNLKITDMDHLIFHPGGKNSANSRSIVFGFGQNIDDTKEVLRLYGNMSSATVLYVLERFMDNRPQKERKA